jgi:hypothetical protein
MSVANMFLKFTPNFSLLAAPLTDMTSNHFSWDEASWTTDYRAVFENFKVALQDSLTLYYSDYALDWVIRGDASDRGCGAILFQRRPVTFTDDGCPLTFRDELIIACISHKFSEVAVRWPVIEKECFIMPFSVHAWEYLLMPKSFVIETTDHRNLLWLE